MADLNNKHREYIERTASEVVEQLANDGQSLAIAREAMINAFDEAAADGGH